MTIAWLFIHVVVGLVVGILVGFTSWFFKFVTWKHVIYAKAVYCVVMAVAFVIVSEYSTFKDAKFIACLAFGYTCFRFWGNQKPVKEIAQLWLFI
jgi:uncharacterized protein YqhQ